MALFRAAICIDKNINSIRFNNTKKTKLKNFTFHFACNKTHWNFVH